jgi:hypothetical protein
MVQKLSGLKIRKKKNIFKNVLALTVENQRKESKG